MTFVPNKPSIAAGVDKRTLLSQHPLFRSFAPSVIDRVLSRAVIRKVKKGIVLFRKGDTGSTLYAVCGGSVRISVPSEEGQDAIFNVIPSGGLFGEIALLDGGARTADAVAIEDSELMVIDRRDFIPMVRENPDVAMKLIELVCGRLRRTSEQVEDVMFSGMPGRLAKALLQLRSQPGGGSSHAIRVTQRDLGQMIGVSRESVNKLLRDWQRHGWIKLQRGGLIIVSQEAVGGLIANPD